MGSVGDGTRAQDRNRQASSVDHGPSTLQHDAGLEHLCGERGAVEFDAHVAMLEKPTI
jgi:hypothetical protein